MSWHNAIYAHGNFDKNKKGDYVHDFDPFITYNRYAHILTFEHIFPSDLKLLNKLSKL